MDPLNFCAGGTKIKVFSKFFKKRGTIWTQKRYWSLNFCAGGTKIKVVFKFFKKRGTILTQKYIGRGHVY